MSPNIFELIQQLCPDGVEYKSLGDLGQFQNGHGISKSELMDEGPVPVIHYGQIYTMYNHAILKTVSFAGTQTAVSVKAHHGDVVVCLTETADLGFVGKAVAQVSGVDVGVSGDAGVLHLNPEGVDASYLAYVMETQRFQVQKEKCKRGTTVMHLNIPLWKKIRIPVPPLQVQQEIVRILDTFDTYRNNVAAGLAGELTMRQKQFQYWQKKLLSFDDSVPRKRLGEVTVSLSKQVLSEKKLLNDGAYPVMNSSRGLYGRYSDYNNDGNAIVVASHGVYAGFISYMDQPFWAGALCHPYRSVDEAFVSTKFLYYYLKYVEQRNMRRFVRSGGIPVLNKSDVDRFVIPIPPLTVQQEIVRVLDVFVELERELERELELRAKQFEYYRDHLLAFLEKKEA